MHFETQENCKKEFLDLSTRIVVCSLKMHAFYFFMNIGGGLKGISDSVHEIHELILCEFFFSEDQKHR